MANDYQVVIKTTSERYPSVYLSVGNDLGWAKDLYVQIKRIFNFNCFFSFITLEDANRFLVDFGDSCDFYIRKSKMIFKSTSVSHPDMKRRFIYFKDNLYCPFVFYMNL